MDALNDHENELIRAIMDDSLIGISEKVDAYRAVMQAAGERIAVQRATLSLDWEEVDGTKKEG